MQAIKINVYDIDMKLKYGDGYLEYNKGRFVLDEEYPDLLIAVKYSDVLRVLTGGYLFSKKVRDLLLDNEEFLFEEVKIVNGDVILPIEFFLVSYNKKIKLIDYDKSEIVGNPFYDKVVLIKKIFQRIV